MVGTFDSISASLLQGEHTPNLQALMSSINMLCVLIVDDTTARVIAQADMDSSKISGIIPSNMIVTARKIAKRGKTTFSGVMPSEHGGNVMLGVRRYGDKIAIAVVSTRYFVELGKSISFGKKGHAAIVDSAGNVLAHPLPSWVASRKNIAKVSAVKRMMNGETGIEQFYSPALKGDMIAGLTSVPGPGWGVMIPQPVQKLYDKVYENNKAILVALAISILITIVFVGLLVKSIAAPLEKLLLAMKKNADEKKLSNIIAPSGLIRLKEDEFLRDCAEKLENIVAVQQRKYKISGTSHKNPIIARIGGDEFVIIFPGLNHKADIRQFLNLMEKELSASSNDLDFITKRSASIGCSRYPQDGVVLSELLKFADIAMYHAKKSGKNKSEIYSRDIGTMTAAELRIEVEKGISNGDMTLEYQPQLRARDQKVTGVEALVRWDHPTLGRIAPNDWVPAISNSPVIKQLGDWVIARAMDDHKVWSEAGLDLSVAVNVGSEHFSSPDFISILAKTAQSKKFNANQMEIEIVEDALFTSEANAEDLINQLHYHGYKIAIDDFGTGYSNIARLSKLPVDTLKIDRSVISQTGLDERVASMMECIVLMAKKLGCETVAEGVETLEDVNRSTLCGVDSLQGFHFSASLPVSKLISWVKNHEAQTPTKNNQKVAA